MTDMNGPQDAPADFKVQVERTVESDGWLDLGIILHGPRRWAYLAQRTGRWPRLAWGWLRAGRSG